MDYKKFSNLLPSKYEDWNKTSIRPKSEQFQEILSLISEKTTAGVMQLLNWAVACMDKNEVYCQIGCGNGAAIIGAILNNTERHTWAVSDNTYSQTTEEYIEKLTGNLARFGVDENIIFCDQSFEDFFVDLKESDLKEKIGVIFYDGSHDYRSQLLFLNLVTPQLSDRAVIIIAQGNLEIVQQAVSDFIVCNPGFRVMPNLNMLVLSKDVGRKADQKDDYLQFRQPAIIQSIKKLEFSTSLIENMGLHWQVKSGVKIRIECLAEWVIYNDIFVDGEYDFAIHHALDSSFCNNNFTFLDIGANVGFFTLRMIDIIKSNYPGLDFQGFLVEGSPRIYSNLKTRLQDQNIGTENIFSFNGLVGNRLGVGKICEIDFHGMNSTLYGDPESMVEVPYINLASIVNDDCIVDLLKCDIEGSELSFLENYPDILKRVRCAVFEMHPQLCNVSSCFQLLEHAGLTNHKELRSEPTFSVHFFWREV
jgi:FkbM family methyltransferase